MRDTSPSELGIGTRSVCRRIFISLTLLLVLVFQAPRALGASGGPSAASTEQALREVFTALSVGNPGHAEEILDRAFRSHPDPALIYQLGLVAQAQGRLVAALDHYRRYQATFGTDVPKDINATIEQFAANLTVPVSVVSISARSGMLLLLDEHIVGMLPLRTPLLIASGVHSFRLERAGEQYESGKLTIPDRREGELRLSPGHKGTAVAVLSLFPITLFAVQPKDLPEALKKGVSQALDEAARKNHLAPLSPARLGFLLSKQPANCLEDLDCQFAVAEQAEARSVLRVQVTEVAKKDAPSQPRFARCSVEVSYLDVNAGQVGATGATETLDCDQAHLTGGLSTLIKQLLAESSTRTRGMVSVTSTPEGAEVRVDGLLRGLTPYLHANFSGSHEITVEKEGFFPFRTKVEVVLGQVAAAQVPLVVNPAAKPKPKPNVAAAPQLRRVMIERRQPRPRWRLALGGVAIGGGLLLAGFGISALTFDNRCINEPMVGSICDGTYTTAVAGGSMVGLGLALTAGGAALLAVPGRREKVSMLVSAE